MAGRRFSSSQICALSLEWEQFSWATMMKKVLYSCVSLPRSLLPMASVRGCNPTFVLSFAEGRTQQPRWDTRPRTRMPIAYSSATCDDADSRSWPKLIATTVLARDPIGRTHSAPQWWSISCFAQVMARACCGQHCFWACALLLLPSCAPSFCVGACGGCGS